MLVKKLEEFRLYICKACNHKLYTSWEKYWSDCPLCNGPMEFAGWLIKPVPKVNEGKVTNGGEKE